MAKLTKKCFSCKEEFRKEELIDYAGPRAKNMQSYCKTCLKEKQARDNFSEKVCIIFGIKMPGPRIWTERKRLIDTFGYTDDTIIDCLEYIYNVKNYKKLAESLCLVKPEMVDEMMRYKKSQDNAGGKFVNAVTKKIGETWHMSVQKEKKKVSKIINIDDYLDD